MARNAATAIAWARGQLGSRSWGGRCEQFVRTALGFPGQYPSANAAWAAAGGKHPGDFNPPAGVPVFWGLTGPNAPYGHVALSIGGGRAISSSNEAGHAVVSVISIRGFTDRYAIYRGWAEVYHGVRLDLGGTVQVGGGGKHSAVVPEQTVEEEDMTPEQDAKLNRAVASGEHALGALKQVNERVYLIDQKATHTFEAADQLLKSLNDVAARLVSVERKVNHSYEADDQSLVSLNNVGGTAYQVGQKVDALAETVGKLVDRLAAVEKRLGA